MALFVKEFRSRLWFIPLSILLILALDVLYGLEPEYLEENIILLPILICFSVFRIGGEDELFIAAQTPAANIRITRFWSVFLTFCVPMAVYFLITEDISAVRFSVFVLSICLTVSAMTIFIRSLVGNNISASLICASVLYFLKNNVAWNGNMRYLQIFETMDILSVRTFYIGRALSSVVALIVIGTAWAVLFFTERKKHF